MFLHAAPVTFQPGPAAHSVSSLEPFALQQERLTSLSLASYCAFTGKSGWRGVSDPSVSAPNDFLTD